MMLSVALAVLLIANTNAFAILRRETPAPTCQYLQAKSNNGDRKIAIVIDSSGSMAESDPYDLRLAAGRSLVNDWLISSKDATGSVKADLVTVINFDTEAVLDYPLGDPGGANSSFSKIGADGGTYIAGGVQMAIEQLTSSGSGDTAGRSGIIVFTDGEDSDAQSLVNQINRASGLGIRVSFGFLDADNGLQDTQVLLAIQNSMGIYNTIVDETSSNSFINLVTVNGLTTNDNPQGSNSTLIAGLSIAHVISGSQTQTITYNARPNEIIDFSIQSVDSGSLNVKAIFDGKSLNSTTVNSTQSSSSTYDATYGEPGDLVVKSPDAGEIDIQVTSTNASAGSIFVVGAKSNLPAQNCTVAVGNGGGGGGGMSPQKAGIIAACVILPFIVIGAIVGGYLLWKKLYGGKPAPNTVGEKPPYPFETGALPPPPLKPGDTKPGDHRHQNEEPDCSCSEPSDDESPMQDSSQNPQNKSRRKHFHKRLKRYHDRHHHHIDRKHPCYEGKCPLNETLHECDASKAPFACEDEKCELNKKGHKCELDQWKCHCTDEECPVTKRRKEEWRKKTAKDIALTGAKEGFKMAISPLT